MRATVNSIPQNAAKIIDALKERGFEAWVVGGSVRDALLGRIPDDWDITTSALPDEVCSVLTGKGIRVIRGSGLKHGTVSAVFDEVGIYKCYEITTYRADGEYSDGRHPDSVSFVRTLDADLARRDLTINAMASDGDTIVDPYGGEIDLADKIIRAVGEPKKRFREDALRILRGLRFSAQLGFEIEENTLSAMKECVSFIEKVSAERRAVELDKLLAGEYCYDVITEYGDLLDICVGKSRDISAFKADTFSDKSDPDALFTLYYGDRAADAAKELRLSRDRTIAISKYIEAANVKLPEDRADALRFMRKFPRAEECLIFCKRYDENRDIERSLALVTSLRKENACYDIASLKISGDDLISAGYTGPAVGESLEIALDAVIEDLVPNDKKMLLAYLENKAKDDVFE